MYLSYAYVEMLKDTLIQETRIKSHHISGFGRFLGMTTFAGTTQKCKACEKTVYLVDQLTADSKVYHKACFRCHHCKGTLKVA
ncbi:lim domain-containing protein wlim1 [Quercus suber]|uniref:Lim domain-containing protein wlim1 n=1 Tax=Quercus suber TaxID=58331 RepID=A0AAW0JN51_QUESU